MGLKMSKSNLFQTFSKSLQMKDLCEELRKSMYHKYIRREGSSGNYKYFYQDEHGKEIEGAEPTPQQAAAHEEDQEAKMMADIDKRTSEAESEVRAEVSKELKHDLEEGEYAYARKSKFQNKGEDVAESARHKRNEWKGLEHAESTGQIESVKRDVILKQNPVDLITGLTNDNLEVRLMAYYAIKNIPAKPYEMPTRVSPDGFVAYRTPKGTMGRIDIYSRNTSVYDMGEGYVGIKKDELDKINRKEYVEAIETLNTFLGELSQTSTKFTDLRQKLMDKVKQMVQGIQATDKYSGTAHLLASYYNNKLSAISGIYKDFASVVTKMNADELVGSQKVEFATRILEGESLDKIKGVTEKKIKASDFYNKKAKRVGPEYNELKTVAGAENELLKTMQLRGLQYGNSVTDDEREYHLKSLTTAFKDLSDITGIPEKYVSFNGKLAVAIGARGKGEALAHYEPQLMVINLTRKNGIGSLAHEWGHALDNLVNVANTGKQGYITESATHLEENQNPVEKSIRKLTSSPEWQAYYDKVSVTVKKLQEMGLEGSYWTDRCEMFARAFESHIQNKLKENNRENTYLAGCTETDGLWPNGDILKGLAPLIDNFIDTVKSSDLINKALRIIELNQLLKSIK